MTHPADASVATTVRVADGPLPPRDDLHVEPTVRLPFEVELEGGPAVAGVLVVSPTRLAELLYDSLATLLIRAEFEAARRPAAPAKE